MENPLMLFPGYRFWRICKALSIVPYDWQRDYVLCNAPLRRERACGQTTAVILRLLVESYPYYLRRSKTILGRLYRVLGKEPVPAEFTDKMIQLFWMDSSCNGLLNRWLFLHNEYYKLYLKCIQNGFYALQPPVSLRDYKSRIFNIKRSCYS